MDYRHSHLAKGDTYDASIATQPFDAYMAKYEEEYLRDVIPRLTRAADTSISAGPDVSPRSSRRWSPNRWASTSRKACSRGARENAPDTRRCADIAQRPVDLGQFDLITSFRFFGNAEPDRAAALRRSRTLRSGGYGDNHRNRLGWDFAAGRRRRNARHGSDRLENRTPAPRAGSAHRGRASDRILGHARTHADR